MVPTSSVLPFISVGVIENITKELLFGRGVITGSIFSFIPQLCKYQNIVKSYPIKIRDICELIESSPRLKDQVRKTSKICFIKITLFCNTFFCPGIIRYIVVISQV